MDTDRRRHRARLAAAAALVVAALPAGAVAAPGRCGNRVTTTAEGWTRIAAPAFAAGRGTTTAYSRVPDDPDTVFVTNGTAVMRSADGGCSWSAAHVLEPPPADLSALDPVGGTGTVVDVVARRDRVYLVVAGATGPRLLVSTDGGASWDPARLPGAPTAPSAVPPRLVSDTSGKYAYLLVHTARGVVRAGPTSVLYATDDGGATWLARHVDSSGGVVSGGGTSDVAVDPTSGGIVYAATDSGVFRSEDSGLTWTLEYEAQRGGFERLSVMHRVGGAVQVVVTGADEALAHVRSPGTGWTTLNTPGSVTSVTGGRAPDQAAITTASGTYELDLAGLSWQPIHRGAPGLGRLTNDQRPNPEFHACACDGGDGSIWSRTPRLGGRDGRDPDPDPDSFPGYFGCAPNSRRGGDPTAFAPSAVTGSERVVSIDPGNSKTVTYRFRVQPRQLDLFFLLDTGQRSYGFGCAAAQGSVWAAERLARERNLRVGVGEYRDFARTQELLVGFVSTDCVAQLRASYVYRRTLVLGAVDETFRETVAKSATRGFCGGDFAGLTALREVALGTGLDAAPKGPSPYDIKAGQQAGFSDGALPVVLHVAGGWFDHPDRSPGYEGATKEEAVGALVANGIKQVGIHIPAPKKKHHEGPPEDETGAEDLRAVARATGARAARRVPCGPKVRAVAKGGSLVCSYVDDDDAVDSKGVAVPPMGKQMVDLVSAITDERDMRLRILDGPAGLRLRPVSPAAPAARLDHLLEQTLTYSVTYACGPRDNGTVREVRLGGEVGSTVVATATTVVRCGTPPPPVPPVPLKRVAEVLPPIPLVVPVAAPAAPQPPPQNLAPNTAPQPNGQPQNLAQGAAVPQEEAQPRLAYNQIGDDRPQPAGDELEMSALPRHSPYDVPPWVFAQVAAALTAAAGAFAVRRQRAAAVLVRRQRF